MRRREFIAELSSAAVLTLVSGAVVTFSPVARAQQSPVVHRVGYLGSTQIPYLIEALHSGLRKLGYVEGKNLKVEYRFGGSGPESLDVLAAELVAFSRRDNYPWYACSACRETRHCDNSNCDGAYRRPGTCRCRGQPRASRRQCHGRRSVRNRADKQARGIAKGSRARDHALGRPEQRNKPRQPIH